MLLIQTQQKKWVGHAKALPLNQLTVDELKQTQRSTQYTALFELRTVKYEGVDDRQYVHALSYVALDSEQFTNIEHADILRLCSINVALKSVVAQRAVPDAKMSKALTAEQYAEYVQSFDWDMSHVESDERDDMPAPLYDYLDKVREGDKYTRIANLFKRSKKRDMQGRTAFERYDAKAFGCYEEAVLDLCNYVDTDPKRNPSPNSKLAGEILRWLDRDVNPEPGFAPDISAAGVPRIRGTKSRYTQVETHPVVGVRLRKHWRQREALSKAVLELLYAELEEDVLTDEQRQNLYKRRDALSPSKLHPEKD
jgi:hypothetical protein